MNETIYNTVLKPVCDAGHPLIVMTKGTFWLTVGETEVTRAVVLVDAADAGNLDPEPFWLYGCNDHTCRADVADVAKELAIKIADGLWPCLKHDDDGSYVMIEG